MHLNRRSLIASSLSSAVVATLGNPSRSFAQSPTPKASPVVRGVEELEQRLDAVFPTLGAPGLIVLVDSPKVPTWSKAYGVADVSTNAPMTTDMHVRIGSNTKTFTATAILCLVDEGKLSLEQTLAEVAPHLAFVPNAKTATIRQMLAMRSGIPSYHGSREFVRATIADPMRSWTGMEQAELMRHLPPEFKAGTQYMYENSNYLLAALVLEHLEKKPFADVIQERILNPLKLTETSCPLDSELPKPHPRGYRWPEGPEEHEAVAFATPIAPHEKLSNGATDFTNYSASMLLGSTNMVSTVHDLHIWVEAVTDGTLLSRELHKAQLTGRQEFPGSTSQYGLGVVIEPPFYGHNGMVWGFHTLTYRDPRSDLSIVMAANAFPMDGNKIVYDPVLKAIIG